MHLPRKQTIYLDNHPPYFITRPYSWQAEGSIGWRVAYSQALVCPVCLRVWARLHLEGQDIFQIRSQPCERHPTDRHHIAGALTLAYHPGSDDTGLLDHLPEVLLRREFTLTLHHYDRFTPQP